MANRFQHDRDKLNAALSDSENYHSSLEHGNDVRNEYLNRFKFKSFKEAVEWSEKPIKHNFDHIKDRALEILMICEKNTMAEVVAKLLSNGRYTTGRHPVSHHASNHSFLRGYQFTRHMFGKEANIWITSTFGHLKEQTFPDKVDGEQTEAILYAKIIDVPCKRKEYYPELFAQFGNGCDMVILLLDNDEEGEAICFECMDDLMDYVNMPLSGFIMDAFYRARFSSALEIVDAVENLGRPNFKIYESMIFKHHLDLRSGVALSRGQKFIARHFLPDRFIRTLSFRPCGSICVKLDVDCYDEVVKADDKYCLEFIIEISNSKKIIFCSGEYAKEEAVKLCEKLKKNEHCEVLDLTKSAPVTEESPPGLNAFELLKFLSRYLFIDSTATAETSQKLYQMGLISYPRSETTKHAQDLAVDVNQLNQNLSLLKLKKDGTLKELPLLPIDKSNEDMPAPAKIVESNQCALLLKESDASNNRDMKINQNMQIDIANLNIQVDIEKVLKKGIDKLDHPPITPTQEWFLDDEKRLCDVDKIVYNFIVRRFLATFMEDYSYCNESMKFKIGDDVFEYSYCTTVAPGFTQILPELIKDETAAESLLVTTGDKFAFGVQVKQCPPPSHLKEYQLIQNMEDFSIGTDGYITKHIESIENAKFVEIDEATFELVPTLLGRLMTNAYRECIPQLIEPEYRAQFGQDVRDIAAGKKDFVEVYEKHLKEINENYHQLIEKFYIYFGDHIEEFKKCYRPFEMTLRKSERRSGVYRNL